MSTKIVVVKLKDVIKKILLALIGVAILGMIIYFFIPKNSKSVYNPGTYSSEIILHSKPVSVEVTVSKDEILDISLVNLQETQEVFYPLFERSINDISNKILQTQDENILNTVTSSPTNDIISKAIYQAISKAKK